MAISHWLPRAVLTGLAVGLAAYTLSGPALAGPVGPGARIAEAPAAAGLHKVDLVTRCWETRSGRRRCRVFYVNPHKLWNPDRYPVGSTEWWRAMDRAGRGGTRY